MIRYTVEKYRYWSIDSEVNVCNVQRWRPQYIEDWGIQRTHQGKNDLWSLKNIFFKGVLAFDANTGFWIQHSMPNYPPPPTGKIFFVHYQSVSYQKSTPIPRRRLNTDRRWSVYPWSLAISTILVRIFDPLDPMDNSSVEQLRYMMINAYSFNIPDDFKTKSAFLLLEPNFWRHITPDQIGNSEDSILFASGDVSLSLQIRKSYLCDRRPNLSQHEKREGLRWDIINNPFISILRSSLLRKNWRQLEGRSSLHSPNTDNLMLVKLIIEGLIHWSNKIITDLWRDLIAVDEKVALSVETWLNGAATNMDSTCSTNVTVGLSIDSLSFAWFRSSTSPPSIWMETHSNHQKIIRNGECPIIRRSH